MSTNPLCENRALVPVVTGLERGLCESLIPMFELKTGSYDSTGAPTPVVELTWPATPVAAPPEPTLVPPAPPPLDAPAVAHAEPLPPPLVAPIPLPVPPGVFCTTPVGTPRAAAPAFVRNT